MPSDLDTEDIGLRFYGWPYSAELLEFQVTEMPALAPWLLVRSRLLAAAKNMFDGGLFVVHILDDANLGICRSAFIQGRSLSLNLSIKPNDTQDDLAVSRSDRHELKILSARSVRDRFKQEAESAGQVWSEIENFITRLVDRFYGSRLVFVACDPENKTTLHTVLQEARDVDIRLRLKS